MTAGTSPGLIGRRRFVAALVALGLLPPSRLRAQDAAESYECSGVSDLTAQGQGLANVVVSSSGQPKSTFVSYATAWTRAPLGEAPDGSHYGGSTQAQVKMYYTLAPDAASGQTSLIMGGLVIAAPVPVQADDDTCVPTDMYVAIGDTTFECRIPAGPTYRTASISAVFEVQPTSADAQVQTFITQAQAAIISQALNAAGAVELTLKTTDSKTTLYTVLVPLAPASNRLAMIQAALQVAAFNAKTPTTSCTTSNGFACFFTAAACGTVGLPDDCWELTALRAFRDGPLSRNATGRALIADYYSRAPEIVRAIGTRADAARVWLSAYWTGVVPAALAARLGLNGLALALYRHLFTRLERATKSMF